MMGTITILQARLGSTRLPNKVLLPLAGKPMVQNIIERVMRARSVDIVVLAVPLADREAFLPFKELCPGLQIYFYPGDPNDLVSRYLLAARGLGELVVRVPCDNPCVDPDYIDSAIRCWFSDLSPFISNTTALCKGIFIDGIGAEVFSYNRLQWLNKFTESRDPSLREHVHKVFGLNLPPAQIRLDVNTQADYKFIKSIYDHFGHNRFTTADVVSFLTQGDPHAHLDRQQSKQHAGQR